MGNHEFCEDCHANDFHNGRPCNPEAKAKVDAANAAVAERNRTDKIKAEAILTKLKGRVSSDFGVRLVIDDLDTLLELVKDLPPLPVPPPLDTTGYDLW